MEPTVAPLARWESFYVIVGTAAAALTGLQFVVIALVADIGPRSSNAEIDAFASPTIVHFCMALLMSAALSAPWDDLTPLAVLLGVIGLGGLLYSALVIRRARAQTGYQPVFEDWLWHAVLPVIGYAAILVATLVIGSHERASLFVYAAVALLLVFIGIHNAWDTVTFITLRSLREKGRSNDVAPEAADSAKRDGPV